ncbi:MAG TPA: nitroreductase/quinone reductase family protein [Candidatus Acidoferrales bacterium]|nr:nitroreductase/quinone reductase family protein [Candidatus Acidoferrales bacterium]
MKIDPFSREFVRWISWMHANVYRMIGGATPLNRNTLILTTRGRKTGREISKPLLCYRQDGRIYIVASYGGNDSPPAWYLNLVANPEVRVEIGPSRGVYRARTLSAEEKQRVWPKLIEIYAAYNDYQRKTSRDIPVVELSPSGG